MKRIIAAILAALMMCTMIPAAFAVSDTADAADTAQIQPKWHFLSIIKGSIDISSLGIAEVSGEVKAGHSAVTKTKAIVSLQQLKSSGWTEIKSWEQSASGASARIDSVHWPVAHGYSYRIVVTGEAYHYSAMIESASFTEEYGYYK